MDALKPRLVRLDAARVVDGAGVDLSPGAMIVEVEGAEREAGAAIKCDAAGGKSRGDWAWGSARIVAIGRAADVDRHEASLHADRVDLGRAWLVPALVNAHTHLDLTHIGPRVMDDRGFEGFIATVRAERRVEVSAIIASVERGVAMLRAGGVAAVGDIGGAVRGRASLAAWRALRATGMEGVSFLEFFAAGRGWEERVREVEEQCRSARDASETDRGDQGGCGASAREGARLGLQPHAPYSVCTAAYARAAGVARERGMLISTHVAESMAEREFVMSATGPFRGLLESLGLWEEGMLGEYGRGRRPVEHLAGSLALGPTLAVHVNDVSDAEIELLARLGTVTVVYCPRASDYFRAAEAFGPHRYRDMIRAGIRVVLGTDSIVNLPAGSARISTLDEVVHLCRRDGVPFAEALGMATWRAAEALGLDPRAFRFAKGYTPAGLVAVEGVDRGEVELRLLRLGEDR